MEFDLYSFGLYLMAAAYFLAGLMHFLKPKIYLKIMPPCLPAPLFLVYLSGFAESALALLLIFPNTRTLAAWGIIALLIAVFPANIQMYKMGGGKFKMSDTALFIRLPFQVVLIFWAFIYTR